MLSNLSDVNCSACGRINHLFVTIFILCGATAFAEDMALVVGPYQDEIIRVPARQSRGAFELEYPPIGQARAFSGSGYEENGQAYFELAPNSARFFQVELGISKVTMPENSWLRQRMIEQVVQHSGPVLKGEVIPLFGCLYTLHRTVNEKNNGTGREITLRKVPSSHWPDGIALDPFGYAVVDGGGLDLPNASPRADILVAWDVKQHSFQLKVMREYPLTNLPARGPVQEVTVAWREEMIRAKKDALLSFKGAGRPIILRIVSIVAPSKSEGISGWVELRQLWPETRPFGVGNSPKLNGYR